MKSSPLTERLFLFCLFKIYKIKINININSITIICYSGYVSQETTQNG